MDLKKKCLRPAAHWVAAAMVPLLLALFALAAEWSSVGAGEALISNQASAAKAARMELEFSQGGGERPTYGQAAALLAAGAKRGPLIDTSLSEDYFVFAAPGPLAGLAYLASRHVVDLVCWGSDGALLGSAGRSGLTGAVGAFGQGYSVDMGGAAASKGFVCAQKSTGPAKISARAMGYDEARVFASEFNQSKGGLVFGMTILAAFMALASLVNKDARYLALGFWLFLGLRVAQISQGTDANLYGLPLEAEWMPRLRMATIATYAWFCCVILNNLVEKDEARLMPGRLYRAWRAATTGSLCVLALGSLGLTFGVFLPLMWGIALNLVAYIVWRLVRLILSRKARSEAAAWCLLGLAVPMMSWVSEIMSASWGHSAYMGWLNNENGVLLSSLMVAMAFAQQIKEERKAKEQARAELKAAYDSSPMGLFEASAQGVVERSNPALLGMLGETADKGWSMLEHVKEADWLALVERARASAKPVDAGVEAVSCDGEARWFDAKAQVNADGRVGGALVDATERVAQKKRMEFLADHDPLTECLNLRGLEKILDQVDQNWGGGALVAYIDLDRFKLINDVYGHEAGDRVLREVKTRMLVAIGEDAHLGRVGGDEFLVLFKSMGVGQAQERCEAALAAIAEKPFEHQGKSFRLSASAGLVEASAVGAESSRALIGAADSACRMAKLKGGEQLVVYGRDSMFFERRVESFQIAKILEAPGAPQGLYLLAQPIMSMAAPFGSLNFEILMRMRMPDGREVGAMPLIETAEAHGHIGKVDFWMLETVLGWIEEHKARLVRTRFICVNFSGGSLNDEMFLDKVFELFEAKREAASYLCVEITESVALRDLENTRMFVKRARGMGVRVALDDFGAGYSSFGYLKELPADALKVDGALVRDAMTNPATRSILVAMTGLTTALGMRSVGEWAEDCEMVRMLSMTGFDYAQGYAIAKPMPLSELIEAQSCADLIKDPETLIFARMLQKGEGHMLSMDLDRRLLL